MNKPIYQIDIFDIENGNYIINQLTDKWFYDKDYKTLTLLNGTSE